MNITKPKLLQKHEFYIFKYEGIGVYCRVITDNLVDKVVCEREADEKLEGLERVELEKSIASEFGVPIKRVMHRDKSKELQKKKLLERNKQSYD